MSDAAPYGCDRLFVCFVQQGLKLGEDHLGRVEVGVAGRQEDQVGAGVADGCPGGGVHGC